MTGQPTCRLNVPPYRNQGFNSPPYLNGVYRKPWSQGPLFWAAVTLERVGLTSDEIPSSSKKSRVFGDDLYKAR